MSYRGISRCPETARFVVRSLWNLTGGSAALLPTACQISSQSSQLTHNLATNIVTCGYIVNGSQTSLVCVANQTIKACVCRENLFRFYHKWRIHDWLMKLPIKQRQKNNGNARHSASLFSMFDLLTLLTQFMNPSFLTRGKRGMTPADGASIDDFDRSM